MSISRPLIFIANPLTLTVVDHINVYDAADPPRSSARLANATRCLNLSTASIAMSVVSTRKTLVPRDGCLNALPRTAHVLAIVVSRAKIIGSNTEETFMERILVLYGLGLGWWRKVEEYVGRGWINSSNE